MGQSARVERRQSSHLEDSFSLLERFVPDIIRLQAKHGITEDVAWTCPAEQQQNFESQFARELERLGIDAGDAKQRVHSTEISTKGENTHIKFFDSADSEAKEIIIEEVQFQKNPSRFGGGAYNMLRTTSTLLKVLEIMSAEHPELAPVLEKAMKRKIQVEAIIEREKVAELGLANIDFHPTPGQVRVSNIFSFRGRPFYFTDRFAKPDAEPEAIEHNIQEICSWVVQQIEESDLGAILDKKGRQVRKNLEQTDSLFFLVPKDFIDRGIQDPEVRETLAKSNTVSLNLEEAANLFRHVPIEEYTPEDERELSAKHFAQQLHKLGTDTVIITDADKGAYVSSRFGNKNAHFYWKKFAIDEGMGTWVDHLKYRVSTEEAARFIQKGEKFNATGCGDSFAATVQFCKQVLGLKNLDFIMSFASKIAGLVLRLKDANIGNISPELITELLREASDKRDQSTWLPMETEGAISESRIASIFNYQKGYAIENIADQENEGRHEIVILVGEKGVGKHELVQALQEGLANENTKLYDLAKATNVQINALIPLSTKEKAANDNTEEKNRRISDAEFDRLQSEGVLVGEVKRPDGSRYAFNREQFIFDKGEKHTIDVILADSPRQAINVWRALMEERMTTRVKIVRLYNDKEADALREQHSKQIAIDSGGLDFAFDSHNQHAIKERTQAFLRKILSLFEEDRKHPLH